MDRDEELRWHRNKLLKRNMKLYLEMSNTHRDCDSLLGKKKPTIIQLTNNTIENGSEWVDYACPRIYAREFRVVDWSGIGQGSRESYYYGMQLRYGSIDDWDLFDEDEQEVFVESGDRNVYRVGPPPSFRVPFKWNGRAPRTHYTRPSFGKRLGFNPIDFSSVVTSGIPPAGYITMWQEKEDVFATLKLPAPHDYDWIFETEGDDDDDDDWPPPPPAKKRETDSNNKENQPSNKRRIVVGPWSF